MLDFYRNIFVKEFKILLNFTNYLIAVSIIYKYFFSIEFLSEILIINKNGLFLSYYICYNFIINFKFFIL